jgi:chorismate--pyruvate lyase
MPINQWLSTEEFQPFADNNQHCNWLFDTGSMTQRLTVATNKPLVIKLLSSEHQDISKQEQQLLNSQLKATAFVREVIMQVDGQSWMYGRTVIPDETLKGPGGQLKLLGTKSLGSVLFKNKKNLRLSIEVAKINNQHDLFPQLLPEVKKGKTLELWARRSMFLFEDSPLLVQEVFLPSCGL